MLSLSPRYDLFRFCFPKDFIPQDIEEKYFNIINKNASVITTPIDYLNESIKGVNIPGISDILIQQTQHGYNSPIRKDSKMKIEPRKDEYYISSSNILDKINRDFKVTFRMNQGLYNYFMMYEITMYQIMKIKNSESYPVMYIELLDETGKITTVIKYYGILIDSIDGLDFSYDKVERDSGTFDVNFKYNNIEIEFTK